MTESGGENLNDVYFDGHYKNIWKQMIPEKLTIAETEFLIQAANLKEAHCVLDLMCGYGRHALSLAKKGIKVMAVDNLPDYILEIENSASAENLPIETCLADVLNFKPQQAYDLVICLGNNLCFFAENDLSHLLSIIASSLDTGSKFIFNSWMLTELALKDFQRKTWTYVGELKCLSDSTHLLFPSRIETRSIFIEPDGKSEEKVSIDYLYSFNEMADLLHKAGFRILETWSIPGRKKYSLGEPRVYFETVRQ